MVWWMMAVEAAAVDVTRGQTKSETSMTVFAIPHETDEEFADFMFSRKSQALVDAGAGGN